MTKLSFKFILLLALLFFLSFFAGAFAMLYEVNAILKDVNIKVSFFNLIYISF